MSNISNIITITSFDEIELKNDKKYLILCDIDSTILHFPECDKFCEESIRFQRLNDEEYKMELKYRKVLYKRMMAPTATDYDGLINMLTKISKTNGKFLFLTSRNFERDDILTKKHLKQIGLQPDDFVIHYSGGTQMNKGEYIKKYINLSDWDNVIFIDDYDKYIKEVKDIHPQIICYKFIIKA